MPIPNVFDNTIFDTLSLTTSLNKMPYQPGRLGKMSLFKKSGVTTTTAFIEEKHGELSLLETAARGSMPTVEGSVHREGRPFKIPYIPQNATILADDAQNVRAFGQETQLETVSTLINDKLESMRQNFEVTHEYHRIGAIQGVVMDGDGATIIYDLFAEFGLTQTEITFLFDASEEVKLKALEVQRAIEDALGATPYTGIHAMCGNDFFDALITSPLVKEAFDRWQNGAFFREQQNGEGGFPYAGITWENYRGKVGSVDFIPTADAAFFPVGVNGLFTTNFAPAPFEETVNTIGRESYAKQEKMRWGLGTELHSNSSPLTMCNRPQCLIKGTVTIPTP